MGKVIVKVDDPKKVAEGAEDPQRVVFNGKYKYVKLFDTLVATKCKHTPV